MSKAESVAFFCLLAPAVLLPVGNSEGADPGRPARAPDYRLLLQARQWVPEEGLDQSLETVPRTDGLEHVIVQFRHLPGESEIQALNKNGVSLLDYLPHYAHFAAVTPGGLRFLASAEAVRAVLPVLREDKASSRLRNRGADQHARNEDGTVRLTVVFFRDVSWENALSIGHRYGAVAET
ncbi:MAG: hypothetical protein ABIH26_03665, partial [Candidatus Eisenbacteria bacterium]